MAISRFEAFSEFQISNFLTDIEIILYNGTIKAHKLVLAASSEFFKVLLNNDVCKEVSTGIINLPSVDFDVFSYIFDHIYLRNSENILNKDLSFYIDVIEASDYLRMLDIIDLLDSKIAMNFSYFELFQDFERISSLPMMKTKFKIQDQMMELINSRQYSELFDVSLLNFVKVLDENFTINENVLWEFLRIYLEKIVSNNYEKNSKQQLIDEIRPCLLNNRNLESFYQFLTKHNFQWRNRTENDLRTILSELPDEKIREMNFRSPNSVDKVRSIPCFLVIGSENYHRNVSVSKISIRHSQTWKNPLAIDICPDSVRCHSFRNHLVIINKNWDLISNFGMIFSIADFKSLPIPNWEFSAVDYNRFWGFSVCLVDWDLYLFGGCYFTHASITVPSNKIIKFNFIANKWEICQQIQLKCPCWSSCVASDINNNRIIYVAGGRSPQKYLKSFYAIDLDRNSIIDYPNMPFTVSGHSMEVAGNFVTVFGGAWDNCVRHEILMLDLQSSIWRVFSLAELPGSSHFDFCCETTGKFVSDRKFILHDLRIDFDGKMKIYSHQFDDFTNDQYYCTPKPIEMETNVGFRPKLFAFGMSMTSSGSPTVRIQQSLFGNNAESDYG